MKFEIGDLVTLSAAGRKVGQNSPVLSGFGMIVEFTGHEWPILCQWFGGEQDAYSFKPYELKFFKKNS